MPPTKPTPMPDQCPFCLQATRGLGAVLVYTAAAYADPARMMPVAGGQACDNCVLILAQLFDFWSNGGINNFVEKLRAAGMVLRSN